MKPVMTPAHSSGTPNSRLEPERGADELGDVGGHRHDLGLQPHQDSSPSAGSGRGTARERAIGGDADLRGEVLDQHRHQVRSEHDPQQQVAELARRRRCSSRSCRGRRRRSRRRTRGRASRASRAGDPSRAAVRDGSVRRARRQRAHRRRRRRRSRHRRPRAPGRAGRGVKRAPSSWTRIAAARRPPIACSCEASPSPKETSSGPPNG